MNARILPGLCSVTFRQLRSDEIVELAVASGLGAIEWGADVHAPAGDSKTAASLARRCSDAGIRCPSYGTYFFAGRSHPDTLSPVLDTAEALSADLIRVWTPLGTESDAPSEERARVADAVRDACDRARARDLEVALEFHPGTLTHTARSALALLAAVDRERLLTYWQPDSRDQPEHSLAEFRAVQARLAHLHVFSWEGAPPRRLPLFERGALWQRVLAEARTLDTLGGERAAYLEFVRDDDPEQLRRDAATLLGWLEGDET